MSTLLVALSHPDDEIGCAGTIAVHAARGVRVMLLWLTRGEMTQAYDVRSPAEVGEERMRHGRTAARILGAEPRFLEFPDTGIEPSRAAASRVARVLAETRPNAVVTWGDAWVRGMRHPDHQATGKIVRDAVTLARLGRVVEPLEPHREPVPVFTLRDVHSTLPPAAVDVSDRLDTVLELASLYRERFGWPEDDWLRDRLIAAGRQWGVEAAEVFDAWESEPGLRDLLV